MNKLIFSIITLIAIGLCQSTLARFLPSYTYEDLVKISDVVVIMEHESTAKTEASDAQGGAGRLTSAKVLATFKGKVGKQITIHHFFYFFSPQSPNCVIFPVSPPPQARFDVENAAYFIEPSRKYLAFLKQQTDGSFIPATPHFDSHFSFVTLGNDLRFLHYNAGMEDEFHQKPTATMRTFVEKLQP